MQYFSIKEFEAITGISAHNLRYFDKIGLLMPARGQNGYRSYALPQIAMAQMILILQQAGVQNRDIKLILEEYATDETVEKLRFYEQKLARMIQEMQKSHAYLQEQISDLAYIQDASRRLNQPFFESLPQREVGTISIQTENILDFFDMVRTICQKDSWYLSSHYGFILHQSEIDFIYPLKTMYCFMPEVIAKSKMNLISGDYLSMYSRGSLENNGAVKYLIDFAKKKQLKCNDEIYIENVSGPAIEKEKSDFIIKIMIPLLSE